ncbi:MAG: GtrA family protein, partial [Clostridiales bacterium]|nr:GtrA family protein [Clostridiales bacterium]
MKERTEESNLTSKKILDFFIGDKSKKQFVRYLITGTSSFIIEYFLFFLLFKVLSIYELTANTVAVTIAFLFNFLMNRYWS